MKKVKKKLVILTGAGISAESGIKTFRDSDGTWENHNVNDVATPRGWAKDPDLVSRFYNERRAQLAQVKPNAAHKALKKLEKHYDVQIITQNIDSLHEKAKSKNVLHLHGLLTEAKSSKVGSDYLVDIDYRELTAEDVCPEGFRLRPNVVWFGEMVPSMSNAYSLVQAADIVIVIGTSLKVYPASSLLSYARRTAQKFLIDPKGDALLGVDSDVTIINETATEGMKKLLKELLPKSK
jgi:NAD-dependent deacetylase